jgi:hypothetical protein
LVLNFERNDEIQKQALETLTCAAQAFAAKQGVEKEAQQLSTAALQAATVVTVSKPLTYEIGDFSA